MLPGLVRGLALIGFNSQLFEDPQQTDFVSWHVDYFFFFYHSVKPQSISIGISMKLAKFTH